MENVHKFPQLSKKGANEFDYVEGKIVNKKRLINALNYINFQNGTLQINLKHVKYNQTISLQARPLPCLSDVLECIWAETGGYDQDLTSFTFQNILVPDGPRQLLVEPEIIRISREEIRLKLPEECREVSLRDIQRHVCCDIDAQLIQNSTIFHGKLIDFSSVSLHLEISVKPPQTFQWIDFNAKAMVILSDRNETLYTGLCRILEQSGGQITRGIVFQIINQKIHRYNPKEFRSTRQRLIPSPNIIFTHPFTGKIINLKVLDVAGSGFSVEEEVDNAVLLPGMVIPELELDFAGSFRIKCKTQVVYSRPLGDPKTGNRLKCGLALLDVDIQDHTRLLALLQQATDKNSYICGKVDLDELWNFFFESGFIYPQKYVFLQSNKEKIKETYEKLYTQNPHIARHFIYQDKGRILGHMAMVRFYENTWLIHHHAASSRASNRAGLVVLDQISRFSNSSRSLYSIHMDYLICYYRPENKFPKRVFGGVSTYIKDLKGCSVDSFAYFHFARDLNREFMVPSPWTIDLSSAEDLVKLETFYENESGGLMLDALDLEPEMLNQNNLSKEYQRLGFYRTKKLFSLKKGENLKAIGMVCLSNLGLNLSELTNCIKIFILDPQDLTREIVHLMISQITENFKRNEIPALVFPVDTADRMNITYEKTYNLWILNTQFGDSYYKYLNRLLRTLHY